MSKEESKQIRSPEEALSGAPGEPKRGKSATREFIEMVLIIVVVALVVRTLVIHAYRIPSGSMEDTLLVGDYLLGNRFVYGAPIEIPFTGIVLGRLPAISEPDRGDIVIFASWDDTTEDFIKRVVGLAGDTVLVRNSVLYVNGQPFSEILDERFGDDPRVYPRIKNETPMQMRAYGRTMSLDHFGPHVVKQDHLFVIGDNRHNSADSRFNGDVPRHRVKARAMIIYLSLDWSKLWSDTAQFIRGNRIGRLIR